MIINILIGVNMFKNYFKITLRNLLNNRSYSLINIIGLTTGMVSFIFLLLWIQDELSFDKFNSNKDSIYRIVGDWNKYNWDGFPGTPSPLGDAIKGPLPEIYNTARIGSTTREIFKIGDKMFYEEGGAIIDKNLFEIFSFPFIKGNADNSFSAPNTMVINETLAHKYFGDNDPVGKTIEVNGISKTISGVFKNIPKNSHLQFNYASSFQFVGDLSGFSTGWSAYNFLTYVHLKPGVNTTSLAEKITQIALKNNSPQVVSGVTFRLQPLSAIHFDNKDKGRALIVTTDIKIVYAFAIIAFFVLLIASINFTNLSTARSVTRAKEVGLRKTVGANRSQLMVQFLSEALIMSLIAFVISIVVVLLFLPAFNNFTGKELTIALSNRALIVSLISTIIITGLMSGAYPAIYLSSIRPAKTFRIASGFRKTGISLRTVLVVFQFTLSIILITGVMIFYKQMNYVRQMDLGFNKDNILIIPMQKSISEKYSIAKTELLKHSGIESVTAHSFPIIGTSSHISGFRWETMNANRKRELDLTLSGIDADFFKTLNMTFREGGNFDSTDSPAANKVIINEAAIKEMELKAPIGKWLSIGNWKSTIIGVVKDAHFQSAHQKLEPRLFYLEQNFRPITGAVLLIKLKTNNSSEVISYTKKTLEKINQGNPFEYFFFDEKYNNLYKADVKLGSLITYFSFWGTFISCLGLFGLASFMSEQRSKEIGIRKTLGASVNKIVFMLSKQFIRWIISANIIAVPIAYFLISKWLGDFEYKTDINWWIFVSSGALALFIALLTVSYNAVKAALANPVESLKYE